MPCNESILSLYRICKEKNYVLADFVQKVIWSANRKIYGPQNANQQPATFAEFCKPKQNLSSQICGFAELSFGPPTSGALNDDVDYSDLRSEERDRNTCNRQNTPIRNTK
jgi:hypothetical protein